MTVHSDAMPVSLMSGRKWNRNDRYKRLVDVQVVRRVTSAGLFAVLVTACGPSADRSATLVVSTSVVIGAFRVGATPPPMVGARLQAVRADGETVTVTTDTSGIATFRLSPGVYRIRLRPHQNQVCSGFGPSITLTRSQSARTTFGCSSP